MDQLGLASEIRELGVTGPVAENAPLAGFTAYHVGGPAEVLFEPVDSRELSRVLAHASRRGVPVHLLGAGSNVLVPDEGLDGLVVRICERMAGVAMDGGVVTARAGTSDRELASMICEQGMTGFEFLEDIPGTVGGGLVQNAEAYGDSISDHLVDVTVCSLGGEIRTFRKDQMRFGYRDSSFKEDGTLVIVEARFAPQGRDDPASIRERMDGLRQKRHSRYPLEMPNCGSVFKRPAGDYAGRLIEQAGLGGLSIGGARVSRRHHNFIVNTGQASASDIRELVQRVIDEVHRQSGVRLERELVYLGSFRES